MFLQGCFIPRFSREKGFDYALNSTITREVSWGHGGGLTRRGPSRVNEAEKVFNNDGKILSKTKRKIKYSGCVGRTFYEKIKKYDLNGKLNEIVLVNKSDTTIISINQSGNKTTN
ncbi:MAG: hypothetical protein H0W73_16055 [Bacteroidetes bacterium]|nr:hypothetical protein [Bacteroidota bacterium]